MWKNCYTPAIALLMTVCNSGEKFSSSGTSMTCACCLAAMSDAPRLLERLRLDGGGDIGKWTDLNPDTVRTSLCSASSTPCA